MKTVAAALILGLAGGAMASDAAPQQARVNRYALVIGIAGYPGFPADERLNYGDDDARAFADFLRSPAGGSVPAENIRLLVNDSADRTSILNALSWFQVRLTSEDLMFIFFSGHGVVHNRRAYLMPWDGRKQEPHDRGIAIRDMADNLQDLPAHIVYYIDACHSGAVFTSGLVKDGGENVAGELQTRWDSSLGRRESELRFGLVSARPLQRSWEDPEYRQGMFTYYLLRGLRGGADSATIGDRDGFVSARELVRFVADSVEKRSSLKHGQDNMQTPIGPQSYDPLFVLSEPGRLSAAERARANTPILQSMMAEAQVLASSGDRATALARYREVLLRDSVNAAANYRMSDLLLAGGDTSGAITALREAARLDPRNYHVRAMLGHLYFVRRHYDSSAVRFGAALRLRPDLAQSYANLGAAVSMKGDRDSGLTLQRAALRVDTSYASAWFNLGADYDAIGDWSSSLAGYRRAAELRYEGAAARRDVMSRRISDRNRRLEVLRDSVRQNQAPISRLQSLLHDSLFDFTASLAELRRRLVGNDSLVLRYELVENLITTGRFRDADTLATRLLNIPTLFARSRTLLEAMRVVSLRGMGASLAADSALDRLASIIRAQPDTFELNWSFSGLTFFVRTQPGLAPWRRPLLQLLTALEQGRRDAILAVLPRGGDNAWLTWQRCTGSMYCNFRSVNLQHEHFNQLAGVYVVWSAGEPRVVQRVGRGNIRDQLTALRARTDLPPAEQQLQVTWARVPESLQASVVEYLSAQLAPRLGAAAAGGAATPVNLPF